MREEIKELIKQCNTCQLHKAEIVSPAGLLQPLPISTQIWADISMYFIDGLPTSRGKSTIFVRVDRLSKYAHFIPISHPYKATGVAQFFFEHVFKLHGKSRPDFHKRVLRKELFQLHGTDFNFSSSYHPQTDGQTEVVNRMVEIICAALQVPILRIGYDGFHGLTSIIILASIPLKKSI